MSDEELNVNSTAIYWNNRVDAKTLPRIALASNILITSMYFSTRPLDALSNRLELSIVGKKRIAAFAKGIVAYTLYVQKSLYGSTVEDLAETFVFSTVTPWLQKVVAASDDDSILYVTIPLLNQGIFNTQTSVAISATETFYAASRMYDNIVFGSVANSTMPLFVLSNYASQYMLYVGGYKKSPCDMCQQAKKKLGNYCLLFEQGYSCLFSKHFSVAKNPVEDTTKLAAILSGLVEEDVAQLHDVTEETVSSKTILGVPIDEIDWEDAEVTSDEI